MLSDTLLHNSLFLICCLAFVVQALGHSKTTTSHECISTQVISQEELSNRGGKDGGEIWLSILGEVYNVTHGKKHYGVEAGNYNFFAGKDASYSFVSGEPVSDEWTFEMITEEDIGMIEEWRQFYANHEEYKFVGYLEGPLYDSEGNETKLLNELKQKLKNLNAHNKN